MQNSPERNENPGDTLFEEEEEQQLHLQFESVIDELDEAECEIVDIIGAETYVDMERLRDLARYGVPQKYRGKIWKFLLNVSSPDKSDEVTKLKRLQMSYDTFDIPKLLYATSKRPDILKKGLGAINSRNKGIHLLQRIQTEIRKQYEHHPLLTLEQRDMLLYKRRDQFEHVMMAFLHYNDIAYEPGLVNMLAPFVLSLEKEHDIYYCFQALMKQVNICESYSETCAAQNQQSKHQVNCSMGKFMMLFRCTQPELYDYFEEEEMEPNDWAVNWIRFSLARNLPVGSLLRLWDTYFASGKFGPAVEDDFHVYVCLAVLQNSAETLMEMEHSEMKFYLRHLPLLDMDKIIKQAYNIQGYVKARDFL